MNAIICERQRAITASQGVREIRAVGSEKQALSPQRRRDFATRRPSEVSLGLLQNGRCHNGKGITSPRRTKGCREYRNTFLTKDKIIMARYRGDLRTKDKMNVLQKK
jgi:hypothetical protein